MFGNQLNSNATAFTATLLIAAGTAIACGPFYRVQMRFAGDEAILAAPVADFTRELEQLTAGPRPDSRAVSAERPAVYRTTATTAEAQLREAMKTEPDNEVTDAYAKLRRELAELVAQRDAVREKGLAEAATRKLAALQVPAGLPGEFADYLTGALAYHRGDMDAARKFWSNVLQRPADQRRYRSVWAVYMLGRSYVDADPVKARAWFEKTRALAAAGYPDPLGLAAASWGWQGRAALNRNDYQAAITCYMTQHRAGDNSASASLRWAAHRALKNERVDLTALARDDLSRAVVTAYLISNEPGNWVTNIEQSLYGRWIGALEAAGLQNIAGSERLAWAAYVAGRLDAVERWLDMADADAPVTLWLKAKLLMRAGKLSEAAPLLARASRDFPQQQVWYARWNVRGSIGIDAIVPPAETLGELGALWLARGQYTQALDALLRSGAYWYDAAYIAERVLTVEELDAYVEHLQISATALDDTGEATKGTPGDPRPRMRRLLARRLTRLGQWREARPYFNPSMQQILDEYIGAIRRGHDRTRPDADRADAFWTAALIAKHHGPALLGYELGYDIARTATPQWEYQRTDRLRHVINEYRPVDRLFGPTNDERRRADKHAVQPRRMFHHAYEAVGHAWSACELMPDQSPATAQRLWAAGSWIKYADPLAADRFYKALATRCSKTQLGARAAELRWFPKGEHEPIK